MIHPVYPDKEWPAFGTDSAFCKKGLVSYETWTQFPHEVQNVQQSKNAEFIAAANPATISELLDRLEAAESDALEQARLNGMGASREAALMAKLDAAEKEVAHIKEVEFPRKMLAVAVGWETKCARLEQERDELRAAVCHAADCVEACKAEVETLRAKIETMEKQEPSRAGTLHCDD